jgi:sugar diacid utilization regulator
MANRPQPDDLAPDRGPVATTMLVAVEKVTSRLVAGGTSLAEEDVRAIRSAGSVAAEQGLTAVEVVDLYLTTAARLWDSATSGRDAVAGQSLLPAIRAVVPELIEGYQSTGRRMIRQEETTRQELVDDLLRGDADIADLVQRAEPFGVDLGARHQIVLAELRGAGEVRPADEAAFGRSVTAIYGDRDTLVTRRNGQLVTLIPAGPAGSDVDAPGRRLHQVLERSTPGMSWRVAVGRPYVGAHGVARSYQEAREAMALVERLHPEADLVPTRDLLIYRVLGRDRAALTDLVESVLVPLQQARGGAVPLVATLEAYFASSAVATETARRLHVSVRTVTYRLARVKTLTGYDPRIPAERLTLQAAVLGARLLPWHFS